MILAKHRHQCQTHQLQGESKFVLWSFLGQNEGDVTCCGRGNTDIAVVYLWNGSVESAFGWMLSRLLPLFPPGARGRQAALHHALLPSSITHTCLPSSRASAILDSPGLTQSPVYYLPYICQFPSSVPHCRFLHCVNDCLILCCLCRTALLYLGQVAIVN